MSLKICLTYLKTKALVSSFTSISTFSQSGQSIVIKRHSALCAHFNGGNLLYQKIIMSFNSRSLVMFVFICYPNIFKISDFAFIEVKVSILQSLWLFLCLEMSAIFDNKFKFLVLTLNFPSCLFYICF